MAAQDQRSQMAIQPIPESVQKTWDEWNLRGAVLVSLFLQFLLILLAASRKRTGKFPLLMIVWSAYLTADWIAVFAIGLIHNNQNSECDKVTVNSDLAASWAPFLLLHLGGPDSITAFSSEDNELWIRHLLGLTVQLVLVVYVLLLAIPNPFWLPSVLVFVAGSIKYAERTIALYQASLDNFKDSFGPEQRDEILLLHLENSLSSDPQEIEVVKYGHKFYKFFRGMVVDRTFGFRVVAGSMEFFLNFSPHEAFKIMEVELNFLYDELFTKMGMLHKGRSHYFFRAACSALIWTAFLLFAFREKANIHFIDIVVTYALLVGAIVLDFIGAIKVLFSDWKMAALESSRYLRLLNAIRKKVSLDSRWSGKIYQHNLINSVSQRRFRWLDYVTDKLGIKSTFNELLYKRHCPLSEGLKEAIFNDLKKSAEESDSVESIMGSQRGGATILYYEAEHKCELGIVKWSVSQVEYDHSLLLWHLATDYLLYEEGSHNGNHDNEAATACKILSDYMMYLLVMRPALMTPSVSSAAFSSRFDIICNEVKKNFKGTEISDEKEIARKIIESTIEVQRAIFEAEVDVDSDDWKRAVSTPLLLQTYRLIIKLKNMRDMWETMRKVWLEMLCYAARHSRGSAHAQCLAKGGELITFVSLLMQHFGMTDTFQSVSEGLHLVVMKASTVEEAGWQGG